MWLMILLLALVLLFGSWLWRRRSHPSLQAWSKQIADVQLGAIEHYGQTLRRKHNPRSPGRATSRDGRGSRGKSAARDIASPATPVEAPQSTLYSGLVPLRDRVLNITVGKYHLDSEAEQFLQGRLDYVLTYLLEKKVKDGLNPEDATEAIMTGYDPSVSNDLLLEGCRDLMDHESLPLSARILVAQYIVNKTHDGDELDHVYNWVVSVALNPEMPHAVRAEAADMLTLSNSTRYRRVAAQALEQLRLAEDVQWLGRATQAVRQPGAAYQPIHMPVAAPVWYEPGDVEPGWLAGVDLPGQRALMARFERAKPKVERTIHEDGQSVHNSEINASVLDAAAALTHGYRSGGVSNFDRTLLADLPDDQRHKVEASLHRIATDASTFKHGTTLFGVMQSLQSYISQSPHKEELNKRLVQELADMSSTCASGHLARLVNVTQGFEGAPQQKIKMCLKDEVYAKFNHTLGQAIQRPGNMEVAEALVMGDNQGMVNRFVADEANRLLPELAKEYKGIAKMDEVTRELAQAAKTYTKSDGFGVAQGRVVDAPGGVVLEATVPQAPPQTMPVPPAPVVAAVPAVPAPSVIAAGTPALPS